MYPSSLEKQLRYGWLHIDQTNNLKSSITVADTFLSNSPACSTSVPGVLFSYNFIISALLLLFCYCYSPALNVIFFSAQTGCPVETMLRRTRWLSDQTSDNIFLKKLKTSRVCVARKTVWSYYFLINIKLR